MSSRSNYKFVSTTPDDLLEELITNYEGITGHTVQPSDPERLFIAWIADFLIKERENQNYVGNQNIPSRAVGENLNALGEFIFGIERKPTQAAQCTMRFRRQSLIWGSQAIVIPEGTRVTDESQTLYWKTIREAVIPANGMYVDVTAECETEGEVGNGYVAGQINTLVDSVLPGVTTIRNTNTSAGGSDEQTDDEYFEILRQSMASFSTAGPRAAYEYFARSVSDDIADVKVIQPVITRTGTLDAYTKNDSPYYFLGGEQLDLNTLKVYEHGGSTALTESVDYTPSYSNGLLRLTIPVNSAIRQASQIDYEIVQKRAGHVYIYAMMKDGSLAGSVTKNAILAACSAENVRPLTDYVSVQDAEMQSYSISFRYYVSDQSQSAMTDIAEAIEEAVQEYIEWQSSKLGRDINPDYLKGLLMQTGIKRVDITSPTFTHLSDGSDGTAPQLAVLSGDPNVQNGGYEDE